jgi:uncharacterized protein
MRTYLIIALLLMSFTVGAKEYHTTLLAVSESEETGATADLYLEVRPGTGRIFMDTFPLTKFDTQISTRFANSIACDYLNADCSNKDFFYTIRSDSIIVGGPSAGSALAMITVAALRGDDIDESIAATGTINSGGLIGPVGGLKPKIGAAKERGLKMVIIPHGERILTEDNTTTDLVEYGKALGIDVTEASTLDEIIAAYTGEKPENLKRNLTVNQEYRNTMMDIASGLCTRSDMLAGKIENSSSPLYISAMNQSSLARAEGDAQRYYSQASFCFGANIKLSQEAVIEAGLSGPSLASQINEHQKRIVTYHEKIDNMALQSMTDLQTYLIVKERIIEADDFLKRAVQSYEGDQLDDARYQYAYSIERYNSALSWSAFFNKGSGSLKLDKEALRTSCVQKLSEAEERYQYVQLYLPNRLESTKANIERSYDLLDSEEYELCLFTASKAKSEADIILSAISLSEENLDDYIDIKLSVAANLIAKQEQDFPILGYSYYEYAQSLKESDKYSALMYAEYALELSNLDLYFKDHAKKPYPMFSRGLVIAFALGTLLGVLVGLSLYKSHIRRKNERKRHY